MGRNNDDSSRNETKDERLLRKARDYIERHKDDNVDEDGKRRSRKKSRLDDDTYRHSKKSERKRDRHDNDDERKSSRKRHKRDNESDDDSSTLDRRRRRSRKDEHKKKRKKKDSKRKHVKEHKKQTGNRRRVNKSDLYPLGPVRDSPPETLLDVKKDYFTYHQHLWVYLYREEGIVFGDLTSEDAHGAFKRFVKRYNAGDLQVAYYDGLPNEAVEECKTTNHKWSFNTSETERKSLQFLQEGVRKQTEYEGAAGKSGEAIAPRQQATAKGAVAPPRAPPTNERQRPTPQERLAERTANRRLREHVRTAEEEFSGGRKDGRERQIEKRKEKAAAIHGAARDREDARMGGVELNDEAIYGDGDTGFQDALARERQRNAQRQQKKQDRVAELKKKEQDKQDAMIKMLGLTGIKPGQKIKIAPRNDG